MKIPKSLLVDPERNSVYGSFAVAVSVWAFSYSVIFGQVLILAYYAVWLPLIMVDYRRFLRHLSSAWLPLSFAAYVCFSVFWSDAPGITARTAVQYFSHIACAYVAARAVSVRTLTIGALVGIFVVLLYSLKVGAYSEDVLDGTYNFVGAFASKNQIGFVASLGIYFSVVFIAFLRHGRLSLFLTVPVVLLSAYLLVISHSATSMASTPAVLALVMLLAMSKVLSRRYRRVIFLIGAGMLVVTILVALNLGLMDFVLGLFGKDSTLTGRTYLWEQGWNAAQRSPMLGVGYAAYWVQGFAEAERLWNEFYITTRTGFHFHNTYIEALVELGFVGATLVSLVILRTLYGHVSAVAFGTWRADSVVLAGVMVLLLIRSFVEVEILNPYIMGSFLMYFSFFKLARLPVARPRLSAARIEEANAARGWSGPEPGTDAAR
ncbi:MULTISPECIES: O-antigen ligase [unclassified Mesorhizobium]|uniref:O-antigen ligase family protein n=1 Tax=unclassified Mesorhizobium TaxID=325217 RepID=UPI00112CD605|nr:MULTISPECIES: O-antigen ligase [unclassified Mesorhizobium]MBZ9956689.1 O-antigen ligase family protein [Mesorhizobium sp. BR1-1-14]MCA0024840.1 O-antigen ligase family protein [Mesorhizobium sp. B263B1A]TPK00268.1 O-antigen ligase family protein [Mesorhizobium sp. B2-5-12]TPK27768.1 O-antigen ligase family protein [Mesorhizobium sp. B2-5-6]TPK63160.1 O-antigen ligase family protein [Mesorhizobium sp. B2-5-1]